MMNPIAKVSLSCCLVLSCAATVQAQSWERFSPPDKSLIVKLPERPKLLKNKNESPQVIFRNAKSSYTYTANLGPGGDPDPEILFGVLRLSKPISKRSFDKTVNSNMLWIGGDDKHFSKQSDVIVKGFHGREFVYEKGDMSGRALYLNGGTRIYFLIFQTETEGRISSELVSRVFNTFRPLK